jgi:hypothetical protein
MNRKPLVLIPAAIVVAGLLVFAFIQGRAEFAKEKEREAPVKTPSRVATVGGEAVVKIDKATLAKSGIALTALTANTSPLEQQAYAVVLQVQDLADARNSYAAAKAQLDKVRTSVEVARKDYQRLNLLHNDDRNVSDKVFQAGAAALATEQANAQAAQVALQSTASGVVQRYGETIAGWLASDSPTLRRVLQQQEVLLQVTLPIEAAGTVPPKTIRIQAAENVFSSATLVARSPRMDPRVQGISFFYVASGQTLVPGMNVQAFLPTPSEATGVVVPQSAVVWWQGKSWIYVQRSPDHFARVEVPAERPVKNGFFVRTGLQPNDHVVTTGAQLLLSEEFRSQIQVGEDTGK